MPGGRVEGVLGQLVEPHHDLPRASDRASAPAAAAAAAVVAAVAAAAAAAVHLAQAGLDRQPLLTELLDRQAGPVAAAGGCGQNS